MYLAFTSLISYNERSRNYIPNHLSKYVYEIGAKRLQVVCALVSWLSKFSDDLPNQRLFFVLVYLININYILLEKYSQPI